MTLLEHTNDSKVWVNYPTTCTSMLQVASGPDITMEGVEPEVANNLIVMSLVQSGSRRFLLRREITARLEREGELWSCELDDLRIMGYGSTPENAVARFMRDFIVTYDGLVNESPDELTQDARLLRAALMGLTVRIEHVAVGLDVDRHRVATRSRREFGDVLPPHRLIVETVF